MKALKIIGGTIIAVVVLLFIGSFFISSNFRAVETSTLKASPEQVYTELTNVESWKNWSYWSLEDTTMQITYSGPKTGLDAAYSWKSEKMGNGTMTITGVETNRYVRVQLEFDEGGGFGEYIISPGKDGGSEVMSSFNSESEGFVEKWMSRLLWRPMMKKAFRTSMENLDKYITEQPSAEAPSAAPDTTAVAPDTTATM